MPNTWVDILIKSTNQDFSREKSEESDRLGSDPWKLLADYTEVSVCGPVI